jgi:transcriptional regulator with XRE-family HTH domain
MKRTINKELMKRLRSERGWSQEELAIASDLSARTVQRLEAECSGSINSIKSIASALEIEMHNLEEKPRTHLIGVRWGYGGVIIGSASALIGIGSNWTAGDSSAYEVGISMGLVGLFAGVSCAFIGWASGRSW